MFPFRDAQISVLCLPQEVAGFEELEPYDMCRQSLSLLNKDVVRGASYRTLSIVWCKSYCIILSLSCQYLQRKYCKVVAVLVSFGCTLAEM